jgi:hypothetical protein
MNRLHVGEKTTRLDEEIAEYAYLLDDAIKGKWVTLRCRDARSAKRAFRELCSLADYMGLPYRAYRATGNEQIIIGNDIRDGGIDFEIESFRSRYASLRDLSDPRLI